MSGHRCAPLHCDGQLHSLAGAPRSSASRRTTMNDLEVLNRIRDEGIKPHTELLAKLNDAGRIIVAVFEPGELAAKAARKLGWDGTTPVFPLSLARYNHLNSDPVTAKWLRRRVPDVMRIFVVVHHGS